MMGPKPEPLTEATVTNVLNRLAAADAPALLFGGWAEEALGLSPPRAHGDIDLLLPAESFRRVDAMLAATGDLQEVAGKRFRHKRAFLFGETLVEVILVHRDGSGFCTLFWGDRRFRWSAPLSQTGLLAGRPLLCVSAENLRHFRAAYRSIEPWRWRDPASLVPTSYSRQDRGREQPPDDVVC